MKHKEFREYSKNTDFEDYHVGCDFKKNLGVA